MLYIILLFEKIKLKLTVCRSLLNKISAINPAITAKGAKLAKAKNFPMKSPENKDRCRLKSFP